MGTFGIDGLSSGLDTTSIINQLVQLERAPAVRMERTKTTNSAAITALGTVRSVLTAFADAARALNSATSNFVPHKATSTGTHVTATAGPLAAAGTVGFTVDRLATRHTAVSGTAASRDAVVNASGGPATITITTASGTEEVEVADGATLTQLASAINAKGLDVRASLVDTGSGTKLQLTSTAGGAGGTFTADLSALDASAFGGGTDLAVLTQGEDAQLTVGTGPGAFTVTSSSNTFTGLIDGLSLSVTAAKPGEQVTVTVASDTQALVDRVRNFVDKANAAIAQLDVQMRSGLNGQTPGALAGNSGLRSLRDQLLSSVTLPVQGATLGTSGMVGLQTTRTGTLELDTAKLTAALEADPAAVERLFRTADPGPGLAGRVVAKVEEATRLNTGTLATIQKSKESENKTLTTNIEAIDRRVELRRQALVRQFSNLEVVLGRMQAQQSWLSSQIGQLNANRAR